MAQVLWDLWRRNYGTGRRNYGILQLGGARGSPVVGVVNVDVRSQSF